MCLREYISPPPPSGGTTVRRKPQLRRGRHQLRLGHHGRALPRRRKVEPRSHRCVPRSVVSRCVNSGRFHSGFVWNNSNASWARRWGFVGRGPLTECASDNFESIGFFSGFLHLTPPPHPESAPDTGDASIGKQNAAAPPPPPAKAAAAAAGAKRRKAAQLQISRQFSCCNQSRGNLAGNWKFCTTSPIRHSIFKNVLSPCQRAHFIPASISLHSSI